MNSQLAFMAGDPSATGRGATDVTGECTYVGHLLLGARVACGKQSEFVVQ